MKKSVKLSLMFLILISFCFTALAEIPTYVNMDDYDKRSVIVGEGKTLIITKKDESRTTAVINEVNLENIDINDNELNIGEYIVSDGINYKLEKITNKLAYLTLTSTEEDTKEIPKEEVKEEEVKEIPEEEELPIEEIPPMPPITGGIIGTAQNIIKNIWTKIIVGIIILLIIIYLLYIIVFRSGAPLHLKRDHDWYYNRAALLHKKAEESYKKGKRDKAEKSYKKSQSYRETGEQGR